MRCTGPKDVSREIELFEDKAVAKVKSKIDLLKVEHEGELRLKEEKTAQLVEKIATMQKELANLHTRQMLGETPAVFAANCHLNTS